MVVLGQMTSMTYWRRANQSDNDRKSTHSLQSYTPCHQQPGNSQRHQHETEPFKRTVTTAATTIATTPSPHLSACLYVRLSLLLSPPLPLTFLPVCMSASHSYCYHPSPSPFCLSVCPPLTLIVTTPPPHLSACVSRCDCYHPSPPLSVCLSPTMIDTTPLCLSLTLIGTTPPLLFVSVCLSL